MSKFLLWWVVDLEQAGGLHGDIRWFTFHYWECWLSCEYCDIIVQLCVNLFYLLLVNSNILLWWVVDLEQAGGLHEDIRQCILFWKCWLCCSYCAIIIGDELSHSHWNFLNNSIFLCDHLSLFFIYCCLSNIYALVYSVISPRQTKYGSNLT